MLSQSPGIIPTKGMIKGQKKAPVMKKHSDLGSQPLMTIPPFTESLVFFKCFCIHPWIYTREPYFASHNSFSISSGHSSYGKCPKVYLKYESNRVYLDKINVNVFLTQRQQNFFD